MSVQRDAKSGRRAPVDVAGWWKLVVAGALIILAVIVAAGLGVEAWFVGFVAVIFGGLLFALGLVLGLVRLLGRRSAGSGT